MGIKDSVGIKNKLGFAQAPTIEGKPKVRTRPGATAPGSVGLEPSLEVPAVPVRPTIRTKATANGKTPFEAKVVLEGKALLAQEPPLEAKPVLRTRPPAPKVFYDCSRCPGYCCSYPRIEVKPSDVRRLAAFHGISVEEAERKFTRIYMDDGKPERILRHKKDTVYDTICRFFDTNLRRCTIYAGRPQVCREYPNGRHCGYYTFIKFERKHQDDETFVPSA